MSDNQIDVKIKVDPSDADSGSSAAASAINSAASDIRAALKSIEVSSNSTGAAVRSGLHGLEQEMKSLQTQMRAVASTVQQSGQAIVSTLNQMGAAGGRAASGMTSVGHASTGVRRELLVLGHEIMTGNWTRFFGSLVVLGERMDLLRYVTGATGVGMGLAAAAVTAFAIAAVKGSEEIHHLQNELVLTGDAAGLTQQKFMDMARTIADANGKLTIGQARDATMATAGTGVFGPSVMQHVTAAVAEIARLSGETEKKVAAEFAKMDEGVYKWANTNIMAKNLVSGADMEYVRSLEEQGRKEEAEVFLADKIYGKLQTTAQQLGYLPSLWNEVAKAASDAWNAMMDVGRPDTIEQTIKKLEDRKAALHGRASGGIPGSEYDVGAYDTAADLDKQLAAARAVKAKQDAAAKANATQAENNRLSKEGASELDKMSVRYDKTAAKAKELADAQTALNKALKGLPEPSKRTAEQSAYAAKMQREYDQAVAGINARGPKSKTLGAGPALAPFRAEDNGELALLKDRLQFEKQELDTSYKANEISLEQYYAKRQKITKDGMDAEIRVAQRATANAQDAARYAVGPNAQAEAQARIIQAKNRVALLTQQEVEQEKLLTAEMKEQQALEAVKERTKQITSSEKSSVAAVNREQSIAQMRERLGEESKATMLAQDVEFENRRYAIESDAIRQQLALENQKPEQLRALHAQLEALEDSHQQKILTLQEQTVEEQRRLQKQLADDVSSDLSDTFTSIVDHSKNVSNALFQLRQQLTKQFTGAISKTFFQNMFGQGPDTGQNGMFGMGGWLREGISWMSGTKGTNAAQALQGQMQQTVATQTTANASVANMTVATLIAANSVGGGGGGGGGIGGGLADLLGGLGSNGDMAGAFGFTATGVTGSAGAVAAGAAADGSTTGLSALMGLGMAAFDTGTDFVPKTGLALIHRGEKIIPAHENSSNAASGAMSVTNNFHLPQQTDMRTQSQIAALAGMAIQDAMRRNN